MCHRRLRATQLLGSVLDRRGGSGAQHSTPLLAPGGHSKRSCGIVYPEPDKNLIQHLAFRWHRWRDMRTKGITPASVRAFLGANLGSSLFGFFGQGL